jgi:hypothetical protein
MEPKATTAEKVAAYRAAEDLAWRTSMFWGTTRLVLHTYDGIPEESGEVLCGVLRQMIDAGDALREVATDNVLLDLHAANQEPAILGEMVSESYVNLTLQWARRTIDAVCSEAWDDLSPAAVVAASEPLASRAETLGRVSHDLLRAHLLKEAYRATGDPELKATELDRDAFFYSLAMQGKSDNQIKLAAEKRNPEWVIPGNVTQAINRYADNNGKTRPDRKGSGKKDR